MAKITYTDKVTSNPQPGIPEINKVTGADMTEIKTVVNDNDTTTAAHISNNSNPHSVTAAQVGALASGDNVSELVNDSGYITTITGSNHSQLTLDDGTNPHGTTKSDVGLSNVDNTSDLAKPISTATQTALDGKAEPRTVVTKTADFTPSNEGNTLFIVDSATDVTVTINTGAGTGLQPMYFYQKGAGQILISIGTATVVAPPSQSFKSEAQYAEFALDEIELDVWKVTGETE